ncbi:hypothetical protein BDZ45DRAFT_786955 [Acephala macrosclerotiorum]|nr:hypothetical protein BDZ45DRAFT_786955 [Acephala macrosclerotiorum]
MRLSYSTNIECSRRVVLLLLTIRKLKERRRMGCIHSRLDFQRQTRERRLIRKSTISKPQLIHSPTSEYSFEEKRPTPSPSVGKSSTDSNTSSKPSPFYNSTSPTLTLTPPSNSSTPTKDGKSEWKEEYVSPEEISLISSQIARFVGSLTTYGQLIEKTHLALNFDIQTILALIPIHVPLPSATSARSITTPETSPPSSGSMKDRHRLTKLPPLYVMPGSGTVCLHPEPTRSTTPEALPLINHANVARQHLIQIQGALAKAYNSQRETYALKYWPLITLLPRNWIMFSRLKIGDQGRDVVRHLHREKGQRRAQDGLLLSMIRNLSALIRDNDASPNPPLPHHKPEAQAGLEEVEKLVQQYWEEVLFHLKGVEEERRKRNRETAVHGGMEMLGDKGEGEKEGKGWSSPAMKWRVFGLVLAERVRVVGEMRGEILRGRVGLSGVLLGVFENVREGVEI